LLGGFDEVGFVPIF